MTIDAPLDVRPAAVPSAAVNNLLTAPILPTLDHPVVPDTEAASSGDFDELFGDGLISAAVAEENVAAHSRPLVSREAWPSMADPRRKSDAKGRVIAG